jgi:hypothetical protein
MELQDVAIVKLQDLPHIAVVDEKGVILHQRGNIFANLLVSIQKRVQRLYPGTGGLVVAVQILENQTLRKVCWQMASLPGVKISLVPVEIQSLDFAFRAIRDIVPRQKPADLQN